jgi:RNA polymerase sigma factor (sigma-70 family)
METDDERAPWTSLVLLERFRAGDDLAATEIFDRYFQRLTALARSRLSPRLAQRTDPEDIVLSVYRSFFTDARGGRYTLSRGGDLWRLLAAIAKHKLLRQARSQTADRRSVDVEIPLERVDEGRLVRRQPDPTPEDAAALADELERVMALLDRFGRRVFELRLQGLQISEIAEDTGRSERSVRRALDRIRGLLAERHRDDDD